MPKISSLPSAATINASDFIVVVDNSAIPETKKAVASLVGDLAPVQTVAGKTGEVTLETSDIDTLDTLLAKTVYSDTALVSGAGQILNIVSLTQAEYATIESPSATTLYVIRDA